MNFSSLSSNEKLAVYGSLAVIVGILIAGFLVGLGTLALLAAIAMLVIVFLPQMSDGTRLPGSKGTLMLAAGIIAAAVLVITLIQYLPFLGSFLGSINGIFFLIAVIGSLVMAWAGWQELQGEGGSVRFGNEGSAGSTGAARTDASRSPASGTSAATPTPPAASSWSGTPQSSSGAAGSMESSGGSEGAPSSGGGMGSTSAQTGGMGSTGPASTSAGSTSAGSTDMGSEGGATRRDDEGSPRNP